MDDENKKIFVEINKSTTFSVAAEYNICQNFYVSVNFKQF